ncbi:hypothetical protein DSCA_13630 [Desulfosarcina alkanivorans]|jgi:hypothetical protein|uniref:Uncharacterized protein n=1 Tax=Desulfosarcina alkanivorans TaxID=571177 RepID=A0A5K7YFS4_9BACT|nr:hypothetical protein DSCA_13630 [Desulfosarcina alkanivorans]
MPKNEGNVIAKKNLFGTVKKLIFPEKKYKTYSVKFEAHDENRLMEKAMTDHRERDFLN